MGRSRVWDGRRKQQEAENVDVSECEGQGQNGEHALSGNGIRCRERVTRGMGLHMVRKSAGVCNAEARVVGRGRVSGGSGR